MAMLRSRNHLQAGEFQNGAIKFMLVGYEGDYIYLMLTQKGKIMIFSNVTWIEHLTS